MYVIRGKKRLKSGWKAGYVATDWRTAGKPRPLLVDSPDQARKFSLIADAMAHADSLAEHRIEPEVIGLEQSTEAITT